MKKEQVEIYSDTSNHAVMRHPERNHPGALIQGDSLFTLLESIKEAKSALVEMNVDEASEILDDVIVQLSDRLNHYETVLEEHGIELPYFR